MKLRMPSAVVLWATCTVAVSSVGVAGNGERLAQRLSESWRWARFESGHDLPSGVPVALAESADETLWLATSETVAWFDGYDWVENGARALLGDLRPQSLVPFGESRMLVVANGVLLSCGREDTRRLSITASGEPLQVDEAVTLPDGRLLLRAEGGLYTWIDGDAHRLQSPPGLSRSSLQRRLWQGRNGRIWFRGTNGLYSWREERWVLCCAHPETVGITGIAQGPGADSAFVMAIEPPGNVRIFECSKSLSLESLPGLGRLPVVAMAAAPRRDLLVVQTGGRVQVGRPGDWRLLDRIPAQLSSARFVMFDRRGDLWAGLDDGVLLCRLSSNRWSTGPWVSRGDLSGQINDIARESDGTLWLAMGDGVERIGLDGSRDVFTSIGDVPLGVVTSVEVDGEGRVWIGCGSELSGTYWWEGGRWHHLQMGVRGGDARIHRIRLDSEGRPWFLCITSGQSHSGPGAFTLVDGRLEWWGPDEGLRSGRVYDFAEDASGALWFATFEGISRWSKGEWRHWGGDDGLRLGESDDGLRHAKVFTIEPDRHERLWFAHQSYEGLGHVDRFGEVHYEVRAGAPLLTNTWELELADDGTLWAATEAGLFALTDGLWSRLSLDMGLPAPDGWPLLPADGELLVGTRGAGLIRLDLDELRAHSPRVGCVRIEGTGPRRDLAWAAKAWRASIPSHLLRTRSRLDRGPWSPWGTSHERAIRGLSPGSHELELQAVGPLGDLAPSHRVAFRVDLSYWRRPAVVASLLAVVGVLIAAFLLHRWAWRRQARLVALLRQQVARGQEAAESSREATGVAEELSNLTTGLLGGLELARNGLPLDHPANAALAMATQAAFSTARLTRQLACREGGSIIDAPLIDLNAEIVRLLPLLGRMAGESVHFEAHLDKERAPVRLCPRDLDRLLSNLVLNAHDAMPRGGRLTLRTRLFREWTRKSGVREVTLVLTDTGEGMSPQVLARVLEPFFSTKPRDKGSGLGLAVCSEIVSRVGGRLSVSSEVGRGSTLQVDLPLVQEEGAPIESTTLSAEPLAGTLEGRALLVEPQALVRDIVALVLRHSGLDVVVADDVSSAQQHLSEGVFETLDLLVVADGSLRLPTNGFIEDVLREHPECAVLALRSPSAASDWCPPEGARASARLERPFTATGLVSKVQELLVTVPTDDDVPGEGLSSD